MATKATDVKKGIAVLWETLQCPICLDLMTAPVSTKCDHQFCRYCITKLLDGSKQNRANCPVCKSKITKRSLQESPGFQRLVSGLQDIIQAYEHDTCTNYFTGLPQQERRNTNVTNTETSKHGCDLSSGDTFGAELDKMGVDFPQSCSSTVAAQTGFAQLMGLEDSDPVTAENEGLDSGLGDIPPTSDKKTSYCTDNLEPETANVGKNATSTRVAKNKRSSVNPVKSVCSKSNQGEPGQQHVKESSRKKRKKDLEPDKILDQKKKKSLEKVAEWLLKVPTEDELELERPLHNSDESDSCTSMSTLDVEPQDTELNPKREDRTKALEEQVFGAVYKRRGSKVAKPLMAKETQTCKRFPKLREKRDVRLCEERQMVGNDTSSDFFKVPEQTEVEEKLDKNVEDLNHLSESDNNQGEHEVPVADIVRETTPPIRGSRTSLQQLDSDFQEQIQLKSKNTEEKSDRRKGNYLKSTKKPSKVAKPLVLVGVQSGEISPKPNERTEEVEAQIETYPSSEDQDTSIRSTRRSRRLQLFVEEIQGRHKKTAKTSSATKKENNGEKQTEVANGETLDALLPESRNRTKGAKRNGCVYEDEIGGIESTEKSGKTFLRQAEAEVPKSRSPAKAVADPPASVVPNSTSSTDPLVVGPTLESEKPENDCQPGSQQEICVNEANCAVKEYEGCKNDSEVDTEQLLRSFKAAKRKSFHFGEPKVKRSRGSDEENAESHRNCSSSELSENINVSKETEKCICRDVISPSNSPIQIRKPDQALLEASNPNSNCAGQDVDAENCPSRSSFGSGLSPNKVSKRERESPLSVVPRVVDSGLRFTAVEHEVSKGSQITDGQCDCNLKEIRDGFLRDPSLNEGETIFIGESSLTPDALETTANQLIHKANGNGSGSEEISNQSSIKITPRKKRRTQRLESSAESDSSRSEEELPTLAQIFGTSDHPQAGIKDQGEISQTNRCEGVGGETNTGEPISRPPASPNPDQVDSSQASVDLFGTPDECDAPENDVGVSIESSQFSSEVLVTQQKIEMQKELVRLEKLMALVSEVLQEKEGSDAAEVATETDQSKKNRGRDVHRPLQNDQDQVQGSDRKDILDAKTKPSEGKVVTELGLAKRGGISETALHHSGATEKVAKSPNSTSATKTVKNCDSPPDCQEDKENNSPPKESSKAKLVFVSSGLGPNEQMMVKQFAKKLGGRVVSQVTPEVTHIIMRTDDQLVCERTLKYFLGIAGRKWVVSFQWISECFKEKKLLGESSFEVRGDVVNGPNHQGPLRARTTGDSNLLMMGYKICFKGPFTDMSTDEMEWMVEWCGATVVKDPLLLDGKQKSHQIVIVQPRADSSSSSYSSLSRKATVVTRGWLLDTVATYTLQNYSSYTV
ncbi:breast cancer type 1 susceptibility protein homolog [Girardinichthys multiradiatus]|uniref:breast cancer type 1 susceptibility protein homolog n=1 Tax=Girardinichthys multiradiatus TaxID=208333 RepID=UPI001FAC142C|nr:breast cancer type 1 susceptibility protein homolog [Girardinichthys multiradiatus]